MRAGSNAVISLIFAEYMNRLFWHATRADASPDSIPQWAIQLTAIIAVCAITLVCVLTRSLGTRVAVVFTTVKVSCRVASYFASSYAHMQVLALVWSHSSLLRPSCRRSGK
jgi:hypothetical protein